MSKMNRNTGNLLTCIFEILIGVLLLIDPVGFTSGIIIIFGIVLVVVGLMNLFGYFERSGQGNPASYFRSFLYYEIRVVYYYIPIAHCSLRNTDLSQWCE